MSQDQILNFRKSLGLDEPSGEKKDVDVAAGSDAQKEEMKEKRGVRPGRKPAVVEIERTTVTIPVSLLAKMKLMAFWMNKERICKNPSMPELVERMFDALLTEYPEAKKFIERNL